jgi:hypothetical protein
VPVQVIDPTFAAIPTGCTDFGVPENDTLQSLGSNGILGIGPFVQDCGSACAQTGPNNPGIYYNCSAAPCQVTAQAVAQQVANPVASFADNNGVIIELPGTTAPSPSITGSLVFGIGTQSNNGISGVQVFPINSDGEFSTTFNGVPSYPAFVDSGSNGIFFLDGGTTSLTVCADETSFYCPPSPANLSATTVSGSVNEQVDFTIDNADTLFSDESAFVFPGLGGPNPGAFDWGLPFFFGRNVFTAIESSTTPAGTGPYWAF